VAEATKVSGAISVILGSKVLKSHNGFATIREMRSNLLHNTNLRLVSGRTFCVLSNGAIQNRQRF